MQLELEAAQGQREQQRMDPAAGNSYGLTSICMSS